MLKFDVVLALKNCISIQRCTLLMGSAMALLVVAVDATASTITWNNAGGTGDGVTWDINNNQNWNNGAPTVYNDGDNVNFNDTNNGNYNITVSGSVAPASFTATNTGSAYNITIGSGQSLSVAGNVSLGQTTLNLNTAVNLIGGGSFSETAGNLVLSLSNALANPAPEGDLTASGLTSFIYNNSAGQVQLGVGTRASGKLVLANTGSSANTIIASQIRVGDSASTNAGGASSQITLGGGMNTLDADTISIGFGKAAGIIAGTAGGTVTIAGTAGGSNNANITVGHQSSGTATSNHSQFFLTGMNATVQAGTLIVGQLAGATGGTAIGEAKFDTGTFTVGTSLQIATDSSGNDAGGTTGTFTLGTNSTDTGVLDVSGNLIIGNVTSSSTTVKTDTASFIINGGTANIHTDITTANGKPATTTIKSTLGLLGGVLNMNGNQIGHVSGNNVVIGTVNMPASGKSAVLLNLGGTGINDAGLTANGGGSLILGGTDTYSNNTNVTNTSTLLLDGSYTGTGSFSVNSGSTLGGKGSTVGLVSILGGGNLSPGDSINTLGVGAASLAGTLNIELNDADPNVVDLL
ncbi:MAG TPA: hypothetical protein VGI75_08565, partial [Pirellulales bacterium]